MTPLNAEILCRVCHLFALLQWWDAHSFMTRYDPFGTTQIASKEFFYTDLRIASL